MKYTIDDLRGKYVKVGTPECDEFLKACVKLGVKWYDDSYADNVPDSSDFIGFNMLTTSYAVLTCNTEINWLKFRCVPFVPHAAESSLSVDWSDAFEVRPTAHGAVDDVDNTVTQRGERYGLFSDGAVIMQDLKTVMRATPGWERLTPSQREALEMIQHKIGRVLNGDPTYDDSWRDIAGYATLILNELNGVKR